MTSPLRRHPAPRHPAAVTDDVAEFGAVLASADEVRRPARVVLSSTRNVDETAVRDVRAVLPKGRNFH